MLALLGALLSVPALWVNIDPPRLFNPDGLLGWLGNLTLTLFAAAVLARSGRRPELLLTIATWLFAALLVPTLVHTIVLLLRPEAGYAASYIGYAGWLLAICLRLAFVLSAHVGRSLAAALAGVALMLLPWWVLDAPQIITSDWAAYYDQFEDDDGLGYRANAELALPEQTLYAQADLLERALAALAPQRPDQIDLYAIGFAGDAEEGAFRNEVDFLPELMAHRFHNADRTLRLINHVGSAAQVPLATVTNLERALAGVAARMDVEQDILLLYLTSHGSEEHLLFVNQPPLPLRQLSPARLRVALDEAGIGWRVIVVSACYSGGFIEPLANPRTLIITAARADRTSFGCGNSANATWFGQAFLVDGLNHDPDFRRAFRQARRQIAEREQAGDYEPSTPQWSAGEEISGYLASWVEALPAGEAVAFVPSVRVVDDQERATLPAKSPATPDHEAEPAR